MRIPEIQSSELTELEIVYGRLKEAGHTQGSIKQKLRVEGYVRTPQLSLLKYNEVKGNYENSKIKRVPNPEILPIDRKSIDQKKLDALWSDIEATIRRLQDPDMSAERGRLFEKILEDLSLEYAQLDPFEHLRIK